MEIMANRKLLRRYFNTYLQIGRRFEATQPTPYSTHCTSRRLWIWWFLLRIGRGRITSFDRLANKQNADAVGIYENACRRSSVLSRLLCYSGRVRRRHHQSARRSGKRLGTLDNQRHQKTIWSWQGFYEEHALHRWDASTTVSCEVHRSRPSRDGSI